MSRAAFRQGNDAVARAAERVGDFGRAVRFICECEDERCCAPVPLTLSEYRRRRAEAEPLVARRHAA
jgi:hypothetical protein